MSNYTDFIATGGNSGTLLEASEGITSGSVSIIESDGTLKNVSVVAGDTITSEDAFDFSGGSVTAMSTTAQVDDDRTLQIYSISGATKICVCTAFDNTSYSKGATYDIYTDSAYSQSVVMIDSTKFVFVFYDVSTSTGYARVGTITGTSISLGSLTSLGTTNSSIEVVKLTDTSVIITNRTSRSSRVGTITGSSISFGTSASFFASTVNCIGTCVLTATSFVVSYGTDSNCYSVIGTITGTSIVFSIAGSFTTSAVYDIEVDRVDDTHFLILHTVGATRPVYSLVGRVIAENAIVYGASYYLSSNSYAYLSIAKFNSSKFIVGYGHATPYVRVLDIVNNNELVLGPAFSYNASYCSYISLEVRNTLNAVISYKNSTYSYLELLHLNSESNIDKWIGLAGADASTGQLVPINKLGDVNTAQTGLDAGGTYYANDDGSLTTSVTSYKIGVALSETDILIEKNT